MKPEVIYTLPDAIKQIAVLQQAQTTLSDTLTQERQIFSRIIQELTLENEQLKQESGKLNRQLFAANEISLDKDRLIASLQQELACMREQMDERLRKGWQLQELQQMLFGKRSERFVPEPENIKTAIQQTLGEGFDNVEVEAIITEVSQPVIVEQPGAIATKTNRHQKRYKPQEGRKRRFATHIETQTTVVDYPGDKTGLKRMGKKTTTF